MKLQITTFYTQIKATEGIDLRDNRGKIHSHALVLVQFVLALLCNRDGNMSRIHEQMDRYYRTVVKFLEIKDAPKNCISRSQLPLFLDKINYDLLSSFILENSVDMHSISAKEWCAIDGKELRGSIAKDSKRGECIVQVISHKDRRVKGQNFYNGKKESEIPAVRELLKATQSIHQKVTMDALHLNPETLSLINESGGYFLVGLKGNQSKIKEQMEHHSYYQTAKYSRLDQEKGHGRIEERFYLSYDVSEVEFEERWEAVKFQTLVKVIRKQRVLKKGKEMYEESHYLSNLSIKTVHTSNELFDAVREHWQVEVNNNIRDTILKEDKLCTSYPFMARTVACCRTLVTRLLDIKKTKNRRQQLDAFSDDFHACLKWLKTVSFL